MIKIKIDSKIRVPIDQLPANSLGLLVEALEITNLEKEKAKKMNQWGWQKLPDKIQLWEIDRHANELVAPRGFKSNIAYGLRSWGEDPSWRDLRHFKQHNERHGTAINLHSWQRPVVDAILGQQDGILKSPAGSGKTVSVLAAIQRLKCDALIIVNTKDIIWQWQKRIRDFLGEKIEIGQIGDGKFEVSPHITIATAQTLHSRFDELQRDGFFDSFSFVCLDECHHATANTYNRIMNSFNSVYRIGVSATPDKTGQFELATYVLGPIFHTTNPNSVGNLSRPKVVKITTRFGFNFRSSGRTNYPQMISALVKDNERNEGIVQNILNNAGHHQLVISKRLGHLEIIARMLEERGFPDPVVEIIGKNDSEHRQKAKELAETMPCVVLSTLADEALDIPRLDRLHLIFPQRNTGLITQQVGRVERTHSDKGEAIIFDYCDANVGPLESQYRARRSEVYAQRGYNVDHMHIKQLLNL